MNEQEVINHKKVIAKFMGAFINEHGQIISGTSYLYASDLKYNSSWDWLMLVVEKIELLGYSYTSDPWSHTIIEYLSGEEKQIIYYQKDSDLSNIQNLFYSVIEFINWHNQQNNEIGK